MGPAGRERRTRDPSARGTHRSSPAQSPAAVPDGLSRVPRWARGTDSAAAAAPSPLQGRPPGLAGTALALTTSDGTHHLPELFGHPRQEEVLAHEAVHRSQFARAGRGRAGTPAELETEARRGTWAVLHGYSFNPQLAATPEMVLAFDHASAGQHLQEFIAWLAKNTSYDVNAIDWAKTIPELLASTRIYHSDPAETALQFSQRARYLLLIEIFDQEQAGLTAGPQSPTGSQLVPTTAQLEDELFGQYLSSLSTTDFADKDVRDVGTAFLPDYIDRLDQLAIVPSNFNIDDYKPAARTAELEAERNRVLDAWMRSELKDLAFRFLLDDFARAVGGPHAKVSALPPLLGSGVSRQISPEQWLATVDLAAYKDRLVAAMAAEAVKRLARDTAHQRLLRTAANEESRFQTLQALHNVIAGFDQSRRAAVNDLRTHTMDQLTSLDYDIISEPYKAVAQFAAISSAAGAFYQKLRAGGDNDAAMITAAAELGTVINSTPSIGILVAEVVRLGTALTSYRNQLESSRQAVTRRLRDAIQVNYDEIAAGIRQMADFADAFLEQTFIPRLHKIALDRITANVKVLRDRKDNWAAYSAATAKKMEEYAAVLDDFARGLRNHSYDRIELKGQRLTAANLKEIEDAAKICHAEAKVMRQPASASKRYAKLVEALKGFDDVKERIEKGKIPPNHYGRDVFNTARQELHLDSFREFTTYGDVVFGRDVAAENPFLARLVIDWLIVENIDDVLHGLVVFVALGLLTVASLLTGALAAAFLPAGVTQAVAVVLFAFDAGVNIGMAWHDKNEAEAFRELVRLDLDQSVTGVSEADADRAVRAAWFGLLLAVGLVAGAIALAGLARFFGRGVSGGFELSLRYFKLAREDPQLFASLRRIVTDPVRLDRMLAFAEHAEELSALLHRMDRTLDLPMVERMLAATGDAGRAIKVLHAATDVGAADGALGRLVTRIPQTAARADLLELAGHDAVGLMAVLDRTADVAAARRLLTLVPEARRSSRFSIFRPMPG